jgi:hypothetical protein
MISDHEKKMVRLEDNPNKVYHLHTLSSRLLEATLEALTNRERLRPSNRTLRYC